MKIALRSLAKSPGFTIVALLTLALGIGVNTTAFTLLNRFLFFAQPYPEPDRLVQVWSTTPQFQNGPVAPADFRDLREQSTVFEHTALYYVNYQKSITEPGKPAERSIAVAVSADFFATLGVTPALGRTPTREEEARGDSPVVLSHAYWQSHLASDPQVLNRNLRFDARDVPIVGVMPVVLDDPQLWNGRVDLWHQDLAPANQNERARAWHAMIARLKPGATLAQAEAELKTIGARLAKDFPQTNEHRGFRVARFAPDYLGDLGRTLVWLIMALAGTVLLIGCVNLANLQLVRTTARTREHAIRLALGASRRQLMQLVITESLLVSLAGGVLSLFVAKAGNAWFAAFFNSPMPLDARVLAFALGVSVLTGLAFGAVPAWLGSRADLNTALKQGSRGSTADRSRHRLRQGLIVAELALALALLSCAGYFVRGIQRIMDRDLHWRPDHVLIGNFELGYSTYGDATNPRHEAFTDKFIAALRQLPGVDHAALSIGAPPFGPSGATPFFVEGQPPPEPGKEPVALFGVVTPDFFGTYGLRLLQGRDFTANDRPGSPRVVIINQTLAEKFWPGENPVGKRLRFPGPAAGAGGDEIVGVVSDMTYAVDLIGQFPRYHYYRPWAQNSVRFPTFSVHTASDPRLLQEDVRKALAAIEPDVAITQLASVTEAIKRNLSGFALVRSTLALLAGLGLLLAAVGLYGVIANLTLERTQEVGVRMALGAQGGDVVWLFLRNGILLAVIGTTLGLGLSFGLLRLLQANVAIIPGSDPWLTVGIAAALVLVALIACWLPARRATKVDPVIALRAE